MKNIFYICILLLFGIFICSNKVAAQQQLMSSDLSMVKASDITDTELKTYYEKAKAANLTDQQIAENLSIRGMPSSEIAILQQRIQRLATQPASDSKNSQRDQRKGIANGNEEQRVELDSMEQQIYGMEIFASFADDFNPDLKIATPPDYIIGPDDELIVNIYGIQEKTDRFVVNPEGNIIIPSVGPINVNGLTISEAKLKIVKRLASTIYRSINYGGSNVQISLGNIRTIRVMVIGQAKKPGAYNVSSLSTLFNVLYLSGGPNKNGSFRKIELIRGGKKIQELDIYHYLQTGDISSNISLKPNDIIRIPYYEKRIKFTGEVKRPGYFEAKGEELLGDLFNYAGGFSDSAYRAQVRIFQISDKERKIQVLNNEQISGYKPQKGDEIVVEKILNRFENRITLKGAVSRPGFYDLANNKDILSLIGNAQGVKEDAFLIRTTLSRLQADQTRKFISFNLADLLDKKVPNIFLQKEDIITVPSIFDLTDSLYINVEGEVRRPGRYSFKVGMTLKDAILESGGFTEAATAKRIEIGRRILGDVEISNNVEITNVINIDSEKDLNANISSPELAPNDILIVRNNPGYFTQKSVKVTGEARYVGKYVLATRSDRISDVIMRAGGLNDFADAMGVSLKRVPKAEIDTTTKKSAFAKLDAKSNKANNPDSLETLLKTSELIGINLPAILKNPHSPEDIVLEDGDEIIIPKKNGIIKVQGEVLYPAQFSYIPGERLRFYVNRAGGFTGNSLRKNAYVLSSNGNAKKTGHFLFFRRYPKINAGDEIYVPRKSDKKGLSTGEILAITSGAASLAGVIIAILNITK